MIVSMKSFEAGLNKHAVWGEGCEYTRPLSVGTWLCNRWGYYTFTRSPPPPPAHHLSSTHIWAQPFTSAPEHTFNHSCRLNMCASVTGIKSVMSRTGCTLWGMMTWQVSKSVDVHTGHSDYQHSRLFSWPTHGSGSGSESTMCSLFGHLITQ